MLRVSRAGLQDLFSRLRHFVLALAAGSVLTACQDSSGQLGNARAYRPIPDDVVAMMHEKGTDSHAPILIRAYKKEAEFEIWKLDHQGQYVHLKTYPMCRWSGQLGPKTKEGDRQVPEGFYTITPGQMNPNSAYYLSFNVGYPNAYDRAHNYTGGAIMVHGDCSSAGCFSMTDEQIAEIYAIAREAFGGGQRGIQFQSLPFRMTAENLAKHRFDPNIRFWKTIKEGADQFEVTKQETRIAVCDGKYVFGAAPKANARLDANEACPPMQDDPDLKARVAEKQRLDDAQVAELIAKGVKPVKVVYEDGGQNPAFTTHALPTSRPDAIARGPVEIPIDEKGRAVVEAVQVAGVAPAKAGAGKLATPAVSGVSTMAKSPAPAGKPSGVASYAPDTVASAPATEDAPFYQRWLGIKPPTAAAAEPALVPNDPEPANVPLPPKRHAQNLSAVKPHASLKPLPEIMAGAHDAPPEGFRAFYPIAR